jgi:hypothetical protein
MLYIVGHITYFHVSELELFRGLDGIFKGGFISSQVYGGTSEQVLTSAEMASKYPPYIKLLFKIAFWHNIGFEFE